MNVKFLNADGSYDEGKKMGTKKDIWFLIPRIFFFFGGGGGGVAE